MKKRFLILATLLCMTVAFTACSKADDKKDETKTEANKESEDTADTEENAVDKIPVTDKTVEEEGIDKFVTLSEYKGMKLEKSVAEVTEEEIDAQVAAALTAHAEEVADATVQDGDIVNIDYEGKKDGEAFEGGSAQGYDLTIGSGSFIDGFETGLVGAKSGETKELNLTFPDNYSEELAGKDVVFTVKINSVKRPATEATDEWVAANTDFKTLKEYRESIRKEIEATNISTAESTMESTAWQKIVDESKVLQLPKADIDESVKSYKAQVEQYAQGYQMDMDAYLEAQSMTQEEFDAQCEQYGKNMVLQALILQAIEEKEGLSKDDENYKKILDDLIAQSGYENYDAVVEAGISEADIHKSVMIKLVLQLVVDEAEVTEVTPEAADATDDGTATDGTTTVPAPAE